MSKSVEIKDCEHYSTFLNGMSAVRRDKRFCDIKLRVGTELIDSHKAVLAAFSPYFSDHFDNTFLKSGQKGLDFSEIMNMTVLTSILDYMYSGSISFRIEDSVILMITLDFFQMQSVKDLCEVYLVDNIDASNYVALFDLTEEVTLKRLKKAAVQYINNNFQKISGSNEFKEFTRNQLESVIQKTRDEDAEITYKAIIGWIKHDKLNRKKYVEKLLNYVSIKHLTPSYYWKEIRKDKFLKNDFGGLQWLVKSFMDHPESAIRPHQTLHILSAVDNSNYEWDVCDKLLTTRESRSSLDGCAMVKYHNSIYAFGERDPNEIGGIGLKYDTRTKWNPVIEGNNLIKPWAGVCSQGDGIYLIGGLENYRRKKSCLLYDVKTSQCTTLPDMKYARKRPGVVSCNSSIYIFGGYYSKLDTFVERYDPREGKWFDQGCIKLKSSVSSAVVSEFNVYCLQFSSDKLINFDTRSSKYTNVTSKTGYSLASLDGRLYIAHDGGIAEYNPYVMEWNEILEKKLWVPVLVA